MKWIVFILSLTFGLNVVMAQTITLEETRKVYQKYSGDSASCSNLYNRLSGTNVKDNPVLMGYYGAITVTMANFTKEPPRKLKFFKEGRKLIETAIKMDSLNMEIHFLRFTIQTHVPKSLHYDKNIESDKLFLLDHLSNCKDSTICRHMADFMIDSKFLNEEEKSKVRKAVLDK